MTLYETAPCERCEFYTTGLTDCEHFQLCPECRTDPGCRFCRSDTRMGAAA